MTTHLPNTVVQDANPNVEELLEGTVATSPGEFAKALLLGLSVTLLVSAGLYVAISGLLLVFLRFVL